METVNLMPENSIYDEPTKTSYTIVRLKRKRNAEPLDALVVQQQLVKKPKRQGSLKNEVKSIEEQKTDEASSLPFVFRFAETVDEISFNDSTKSQQLKDRITKLINRKEKVRLKERSKKQTRDQQITWFKENTRRERYKVIDRNRQSGSFPHFSSDSIEDEENAADEMFKMYDAVKEEIPIAPKLVALFLIEESNNFMEIHGSQIHRRRRTWFNDDDNGIFVKGTTEKDEYEYSDEEDSNAEDYYTHDYPDEEEVWSEQGTHNLNVN
ncbi:20063_t:CDS:2 [Cetraspora pellucida]|uniref:Probable RNA polymerase II nuclear localization protein SLC7A6OS n=1 Tax=Cetraspora pellucida TaxID=1433469 RepID=A0A9N9NRX2_9GLOM|nr:20063_t:CDS:2 [Cetraspora pellucida]